MIYVTSDLHGCNPADFKKLLAQVGFGDEDYLYILGDVIDRGTWGAQLLFWLTQQTNIQLILGNHEALMLTCSFIFDQVAEDAALDLSDHQLALLQSWSENGGDPTLKGLHALLKYDPECAYGIMDYLRDAPLYETLRVNGQSFILVHSGLDNFQSDRSLEDYKPEELLFCRPSPDTRYYTNARVIFGHTPSIQYGEEYAGRAFHTESWSCIDVGVALGHSPMLLCLDTMEEFYLEQ